MPPVIARELVLKSRVVTRTAEGTQIVRVYEFPSNDPEAVYPLIPPHGAYHPDTPYSNFIKLVDSRLEYRDGYTLVTLTYKEPSLETTIGGEVWEWDIAGQQQHITSVPSASYQIHYPDTSDEAGTVIGFNGENVEGTDVFRTSTSLRVVKTWPVIDMYDRNLLTAISCTVNQYDWFDYEAGEVLFLGSKIRQQTDDTIKIEYNFLVNKIKAPVEVELLNGDSIPVAPLPWDYVWYRSTEKIVTDGVTGKKKKKRGIKSIHISRVYEFQDFSVFGFSGPYG